LPKAKARHNTFSTVYQKGVLPTLCWVGVIIIEAAFLLGLDLLLDESHPQPLVEYAVGTRNAATNTWGWPAILWVTCKFLGTTVKIARMPAVIAGTALNTAIVSVAVCIHPSL
jgi:hypothetical protein